MKSNNALHQIQSLQSLPSHHNHHQGGSSLTPIGPASSTGITFRVRGAQPSIPSEDSMGWTTASQQQQQQQQLVLEDEDEEERLKNELKRAKV